VTTTNKPTRTGNHEIIRDEQGNIIRPYRIGILFRCGCGFSSAELDKAVEHCMEWKHSLTVVGGIQYLKYIPKQKVREAVESQTKYDYKFDELRRKLAGTSTNT